MARYEENQDDAYTPPEDEPTAVATSAPPVAPAAPTPAPTAVPAPAADAAPAQPYAPPDQPPPTTPDGRPLTGLPPGDTALPEPKAAPAKPDYGEDDFVGGLGTALHGGITRLMNMFGLDDKEAAVRDPERYKLGQQGLVEGYGAAKGKDARDAMRAVDPERRLTHAQAMIKAMTKGYEHYLQLGNQTAADNLAASIIQYSTHEASMYASTAMRQLKQGDNEGAARSLTRASQSSPWVSVYDIKGKKGDPNFKVDENDPVTGKLIATHEVTGEQLFNLAQGAANKSSVWAGLMEAAGNRPGHAKPAKTFNDVDNATNADLKLGINPDRPGTGPSAVTPEGKPGEGGGAGAAPVDLRPENKEQLAQMMPTYDKMMLGGESFGGQDLPATQGHQAAGAYQIQPDTWKLITHQSPWVNGKDQRLDRVKSKEVFEKLTAYNAAKFEQEMQRMPSLGELALMHQQGTTGGIKLIKAAETNPNALATTVVPRSFLASNGIKDPKATVADATQFIQNYYLRHAGPGAAGAAQPVRLAQNMAPGAPMSDASPAPIGAPPAPGAPEAVPTGPKIIPLESARNGPAPSRAVQNPFATHAPLPGDMPAERPQLQAFTPKPAPHWTPRPGASEMGKSAVQQGNKYWEAQTNKENEAAKFNTQKFNTEQIAAYKARLKEIADGIGKASTSEQSTKARALVDDLSPPENTPEGIKFGQLQAGTQAAVKNAMFTIALRNPEFPPGRIYNAAMSLAAPPKDQRNAGFSVHATPNDRYMRVRFRDGEDIIVTKSQLAELAGAMGNEHYIRRMETEKGEQHDANVARRAVRRAEDAKKAGTGWRGLAIGLGQNAEGGAGLMTADRAIPDDEFAD